jgi:hypothetical protein
MTLHGTISQGTIVLDRAAKLPEGTRVEVVIVAVPATPVEDTPTLAQRLLKHAGTVTDLPPDLAEQHDHYLHGTSKRLSEFFLDIPSLVE